MMRMCSFKILVAIAVPLLLVATAAFADCPMHQKQTQTGYRYGSHERGSSSCPTSAKYGERRDHGEYEGSTYMGRYDQHDENCLFTEVRQDHREIKTHLNAIETGRRSDRAMHWAELRNVLLPHMQAEERTLYPALQQQSRGNINWGLIGEEEHAAAASIFQKLDGGDPTNERWFARFLVFSHAVKHHADEEESQIFSAARRNLSGSQLAGLCTDFMNQRIAAANNLPSAMQPASYQSSTWQSSSSMQSPTYGQCIGFDDLSKSNMTFRCPSCAEIIGTITPVSETVIIYGEAAPEKSPAETTAAPDATEQPMKSEMMQPEAQTETSVTQPQAETQMPMGTMQCPHCGAGIGTVCPSTPSGAMDTSSSNQIDTSMSQPSSSSSSNNDTRY